MKREIFLSFSPNFFRPILYGIKKYEYRKRFCKEPTTAYLYLSSPIQEIIGIMQLGRLIKIEDVINNYDNSSITYERLSISMESGEKFAIPIESLQLFKEPIGINKIKELSPNFFVPQCYLDITKHQKLYDYIKNQELYELEFTHSHNNIYHENIGCTCREMETFQEFKELDDKYVNDSKYDIVKSRYLLRRTK
ncbi:MAG: hypothetical protein ACK5HL_01495 [Bacilli bacterium]